jgi:hypothetical protein
MCQRAPADFWGRVSEISKLNVLANVVRGDIIIITIGSDWRDGWCMKEGLSQSDDILTFSLLYHIQRKYFEPV